MTAQKKNRLAYHRVFSFKTGRRPPTGLRLTQSSRALCIRTVQVFCPSFRPRGDVVEDKRVPPPSFKSLLSSVDVNARFIGPVQAHMHTRNHPPPCHFPSTGQPTTPPRRVSVVPSYRAGQMTRETSMCKINEHPATVPAAHEPSSSPPGLTDFACLPSADPRHVLVTPSTPKLHSGDPAPSGRSPPVVRSVEWRPAMV